MRVILFVTFISSLNCFASETDDAIKKIQKAILAYPKVKQVKKKLENRLLKYSPLDKDILGVVGGIAMGVSQGHIDTKVIKKMNFKLINGTARPNIRYNIKNGETNGSFSINWNF